MHIKTTSFVLIASAALFSCGKATQPKPACRAQNAEYAARYLDPMEISGTCTDKIITGEVLHLTYYRMTPAGGIPKLAIEPATIADAVAAAEEAMPAVEVEHAPEEFSLGSFKSDEPDDKDICTAATLSEAGVKVPMIGDPMMDGHAAVDVSYKWSNVQFITQPLSNAIHFGADLERRDGDCVVKYKVSGINPALHCGDGKELVDTEEIDPMTGKPVVDPATGMTKQVEVDAPWTGKPVQEACEPSKVGEAHGSGLSPDFVYECEEHTLLCLPTKKFPARK